MVKNVFVIVSFSSDKHMRKKPTEMFAELEQIKNLHGMSGLLKSWSPHN